MLKTTKIGKDTKHTEEAAGETEGRGNEGNQARDRLLIAIFMKLPESVQEVTAVSFN